MDTAAPRLRIILALLVLALAWRAAACIPEATGYRVYTQTEGIARFSLEYSAKYRRAGGDIVEQVSSVYFDRVYGRGNSYTTFSVFAAKVGVYAETAQSYLEEELALAGQYKRDFKLPNTSRLEVAGATAIQVVYSYTRIRYEPLTGAVVKGVFFESDGVIWKIELDALADTAEADMADFDHVLATFRILD